MNVRKIPKIHGFFVSKISSFNVFKIQSSLVSMFFRSKVLEFWNFLKYQSSQVPKFSSTKVLSTKVLKVYGSRVFKLLKKQSSLFAKFQWYHGPCGLFCGHLTPLEHQSRIFVVQRPTFLRAIWLAYCHFSFS